MMHYHPELVDLDTAGEGRAGGFRSEELRRGTLWIPREWTRVSRDTGIGSPKAATAEKGARFADAVTSHLARAVADLTGSDLYLPIPE